MNKVRCFALATTAVLTFFGTSLTATETLPCLRTGGSVSMTRSLGAGLTSEYAEGFSGWDTHDSEWNTADSGLYQADGVQFQDGGNYANANYVLTADIIPITSATSLAPNCSVSGGLQNFAYSVGSTAWAFMECNVVANSTFEIQAGTSTSTDATLNGMIDVIVGGIVNNPSTLVVSFTGHVGSGTLSGSYMGPGVGWWIEESSSSGTVTSGSSGENYSDILTVTDSVSVGGTVTMGCEFYANLLAWAYNFNSTNWWNVSVGVSFEVVQ